MENDTEIYCGFIFMAIKMYNCYIRIIMKDNWCDSKVIISCIVNKQLNAEWNWHKSCYFYQSMRSNLSEWSDHMCYIYLQAICYAMLWSTLLHIPPLAVCSNTCNTQQSIEWNEMKRNEMKCRCSRWEEHVLHRYYINYLDALFYIISHPVEFLDTELLYVNMIFLQIYAPLPMNWYKTNFLNQSYKPIMEQFCKQTWLMKSQKFVSSTQNNPEWDG